MIRARAIRIGKSLRPNRLASALLSVLLLSACGQQKEDRFVITPTTYDAIDGWKEDALHEALPVFKKSCKTLVKSVPKRPSIIKPSLDAWAEVCERAAHIQPQNESAASKFWEEWFVPFVIANDGKEEGLITGYFEPLLFGSRQKKPPFTVPVYGVPDDLKKGVPYYSRKEIEDGALEGKGLEILWVDSAVDLFFTHIQGSALVHLTDGSEIRIGYAGKNGHGYTAIGKTLIDIKAIEKKDVSMQSIKAWLKANPAKARHVMDSNASYVFFKEQKADAAVGAQGIPLTNERSIAIDHRNLAYGLPVFLNTTLPSPDGRELPYKRLMIAQDTGGAIKGPVRADVFFGAGADAEWLAGHMKQKGRMVVLVPSSAVDSLER